MNKRSYRRFTTDEKRMILTEVAQPGVTLSEVCRKHSVSPALVYRWRAVAQQATTQALQKVDSRGKTQPDAQTARLQAEPHRRAPATAVENSKGAVASGGAKIGLLAGDLGARCSLVGAYQAGAVRACSGLG